MSASFSSHHTPLQKQKLYATKITKYHQVQNRMGCPLGRRKWPPIRMQPELLSLTYPSGLRVSDLPWGKDEAQYSPGRFCAMTSQPQEERTSQWKPALAWERHPQTRCWWLAWLFGARHPSPRGTAPGSLQLSLAGTKKTCSYPGSKGNSPPACRQLLLLLLQKEVQVRSSRTPHVCDMFQCPI